MKHSNLLIVANEPEAGKEEEYNAWYSERHIPMMFEFQGLRRAARYRLTGGASECSKYLTVYEFNSREDVEAFFRSAEYASAVRDFDEKWKNGGFKAKWGGAYELIKAWEKAEEKRS